MCRERQEKLISQPFSSRLGASCALSGHIFRYLRAGFSGTSTPPVFCGKPSRGEKGFAQVVPPQSERPEAQHRVSDASLADTCGSLCRTTLLCSRASGRGCPCGHPVQMDTPAASCLWLSPCRPVRQCLPSCPHQLLCLQSRNQFAPCAKLSLGTSRSSRRVRKRIKSHQAETVVANGDPAGEGDDLRKGMGACLLFCRGRGLFCSSRLFRSV
jgi:hypothetical protein